MNQVGAFGSSAGTLVVSSAQTVSMPSISSRFGAARYVSHTSRTCCSKAATSFGSALSQYRFAAE